MTGMQYRPGRPSDDEKTDAVVAMLLGAAPSELAS